MSLIPLSIQGYKSGLQKDKKPFALMDDSFPQLENAYCWRERIVKREGLKLVGRLRRLYINTSIGVSGASPWTFNIYTTLVPPLVSEPNAMIEPGSVVITIAPITTTGPVQGYTIESNAVVLSAGHGLVTGSSITISGVVVVPDTGPDTINIAGPYIITVIDANNFSLGISSEDWGTWDSGGTWTFISTAQQQYFDNGNGTLDIRPASGAIFGTINYQTGDVILTGDTPGQPAIITFGYYPGLPVMGIITRDIPSLNNEQTVFFDTKYAYIHDGEEFVEMPSATATTWSGNDSDFFWGVNYRGSEPNDRLFFVTNFAKEAGDPMRYWGPAPTTPFALGWNTFAPIVGSKKQIDNFPDFLGGAAYADTLSSLPIIPGTISITVETTPPIVFRDTPKDGTLVASGLNVGTINYATGAFILTFNPAQPVGTYKVDAAYNYGTTNLYQARILIAYYGRLLALNVWEGTSIGASVNIFNRCRFSQVGSPVQNDAWRSDTFGKGGYIDAPTNEEIVSAIFYKNTLIVFFERSTWQLRYVGEVGLPFIWERISSDFGGESTFSAVLFDQGVLAVGDRAIVSSTGINVSRIDEQIPDTVFSFNNLDNGPKRVHGIRDYKKELVYWCYPLGELKRKYPNYSLVFNYRNNTFATFRNNVTCFGSMNSPGTITWDSQSVTWDDELVTWDDDVIQNFPLIVSGDQHGFVHFYGYPDTEQIADSQVNAIDQESLYITAIDLTHVPPRITVPSHNLENNEIIYIIGLTFMTTVGAIAPKTVIPIATDLNGKFYRVQRIDDNTLDIYQWNFTQQDNIEDYTFTPAAAGTTYMGGGMLALFPVLNIRTKDFSPFDKKGMSSKLAYVDFLVDAMRNAEVTINLFINSQLEASSTLPIGNTLTVSPTSTGQIAGVSNTNPAVVTTLFPHGLVTGDNVDISGVVGVTSGLLNVNNNYNITFVNSNQFSLDGLDTTAYSVYSSGGVYVQQNYPFYSPGSDYEWHRFYGGCSGQFIAVNITYDNPLMNNLNTHKNLFILNAMKLWVKEATRGIF